MSTYQVILPFYPAQALYTHFTAHLTLPYCLGISNANVFSELIFSRFEG